jgi:NDP-sugar pyrophosphorylase family protein
MTMDDIKKEIENTQVCLLVGGKAKRMNNEIKCLKEINGISLLERTLLQYANHGFRKFHILAGYGHEEVENHIKTKSKCAKQIDVTFSLDDKSWKAGGKGKALKQALKNGTIDKSKRSIIVFPDDVFLDDKLPINLLSAHLDNVKSFLVTVATVQGTDYPFGEVVLDSGGKVEKFLEKPFVSKHTSTGLYVMEPQVYSEINTMIDLDSSTSQEFEKIVLEKIAREGKVANYTITPYDSWISVNTSKEFEMAKSRLEKN